MENSLWWLMIIATMAAVACYQDICYRRIPNGLIVCILLVGTLHLVIYSAYENLFAVVGVLIAGALLFKLGVLAAGDSKLLAAFSLMITPDLFVITLLTITFLGGVMAMIQWLFSRLLNEPLWLMAGVPYGVPISLASLLGIAASL